ncbi:hypothetical protein [Priestia abyssalis]|uniref:hypothetical protein n=1 Tax=Priestia abyssalis TaxID=1221450 RepID=UPI0011179E27|nr:hypothetical protein [Priestia abyssalis]
MFIYPYSYVQPQSLSWSCPYYLPYSEAVQPMMSVPDTPYRSSTLAYPNSLRPYMQVDPTLFNQSAITMQALMKEASILLNKLAESKEFDSKIMTAAQQSNTKEVDKLIKSTGIKSKVKTSFNPDGITLKLSSKVGGTECCHLTIALRWM